MYDPGSNNPVQPSPSMADATLSPDTRELEDVEVIDVTEIAHEGHRITQDVGSVPPLDHVSPSVVEEEPPLEQARASTHTIKQQRQDGPAVSPRKKRLGL
jgi:hypothetical protein